MLRRLSILLVFLFGVGLVLAQLADRGPAAPPVAAAPRPSSRVVPATTPAPSRTVDVPEVGGPLPVAGEPAAVEPAPALAARPAPPPAAGGQVAFESAAAADRRARQPLPRPAAVRDVTPPSPPAELVVEADGPDVKLSWPAAADDTGADRYDVLRDGKVFVSTSAPGAVDEGAPPLRRLCYAVIAIDAAGNRSRPTRERCATLADVVPPSAPTAVQARSTSESSVALTWSGAADTGGVVSYDVVRAGLVVATADSPRSAESGLLAGRTYCWAVRARDAAGNVSGDSPEACVTVRDQTPPAPPPDLVAAPAGPDSVALAWQPAQDNVGVDRYEVLHDGHLVARVAAARVSAVERGLPASTDHCYTVVAVDGSGNRSRPTPAACARTAAAGVPSGPTALALSPSPRSPSAVVLRWEASPEPGVVYTVYWNGDKRIGATPRNEYTVVGLRAGERRCFRVAAVDPAGRESPSSLEACLVGTISARR